MLLLFRYKIKIIYFIIFFIFNIYLIWNLISEYAISFEYNIYITYNYIFWIILYILITSIFVIMFISGVLKLNYWRYCICLIVFYNTIFLLIPSFRGWIMYSRDGYDIIFHSFHINYIMQNGTIDNGLIYPSLHIIVVFLNKFSGVSLNMLIVFIPIFFYNLFIIFLFLMVKKIFKNIIIAIVAISISSFLPFSFLQKTIHPNFMAFCLFPLIIYMLYKYFYIKKDVINIFLIILVFISFIYFHPFNAFEYLLCLIIFGFTSYVYFKKYNIKTDFKLIYILILIYMSWLFLSNRPYTVFSQIVNRILNDPFKISLAQYNTQVISQYGLTINQLIIYLFNQYGQFIIQAILGLFILLYISRKVYHKQINKYDLIMILQILGGLILFFMTYFVEIGTFNIIRNIRYFYIFLIMFNSYSIINFIKKIKKKNYKLVTIFIVVLLITLSNYFSINNVYANPNIFVESPHFTIEEDNGLKFFTENNYIILPLISSSYDIRSRNNILLFKVPEIIDLPSHFGFDKETSFINNLKKDSYLITNDAMRQAYKTFISVNPETKLFTKEEFSKLENNIKIINVYRSGGFEIRVIIH